MSVGLRRDLLEDFVLDTLKDHLMHPDLVKAFIAEFHAETNKFAAERDRQILASKRQLAGVTRKLDGLIDAIAEGLRSPGIDQRLKTLELEKARLEAEISAAPSPIPRLHPNLAEIYRKKVAELKSALQDPAHRDEALTILRGLISSVSVATTEDGFDIEFVGEIAHMIRLPDDGAKTRPMDDRIKISAKRVAGARNHLY